MSFASVAVIVACLLIMGSFSMVAVNINSIISDLEKQNEVVAFVDEDYTESQARASGAYAPAGGGTSETTSRGA